VHLWFRGRTLNKLPRIIHLFRLRLRVVYTPRNVAIFVVCLSSVALADDFKTINGKEYKDATVSRVEADGIVLRIKTGISKVYFIELPKDVQQKFRPAPATPTVAPIKQHTPEQVHRGGKVVVVGQSVGSLKVIGAGILVLLVVLLVVLRNRSRMSKSSK